MISFSERPTDKLRNAASGKRETKEREIVSMNPTRAITAQVGQTPQGSHKGI